ncbi:hypothetical protein FXO26_05490 [Pseudomonas synxantha]|uniref:Uncharacterized protein n=1 Tax=Pseudomonas synxantha TaxID=47883 RepID=A0A5D3GF71_9PSED|nr:hypothetical protein FXO26_05490 [Pseudomonas synxantha]
MFQNAKNLLTRFHLDFFFCFWRAIFYSEKTAYWLNRLFRKSPLTIFRWLAVKPGCNAVFPYRNDKFTNLPRKSWVTCSCKDWLTVCRVHSVGACRSCRAVYNAPRFTVTPLAYPRKRPRPQGSIPLIIPPGHEPDGFDFVTDKNKQVTYDH